MVIAGRFWEKKEEDGKAESDALFLSPLLLRCQMRVGGSWFLRGFRSLLLPNDSSFWSPV
jgi:hypothetical protein